MKFETVRNQFLSDVLICCHPEILLLWQCDVTTSPLCCCGRQEEPANLISGLLLRMRRIYVVSICLDFH